MPKFHRPDPSTLGPNYYESRDAVAEIWGERTPFYGEGNWPSRVDSQTVDKPDKWVSSACISCSIGCGVDIGVKDGKVVGVRGRENDRVNKGRLGPKGMYAWQSMASKDRLKFPMIRNKDGQMERATWDEAMDLIVRRTKDVQKRLTSHGIAFYTSGQLFLEEYLTLAVIGKAGLGTLHMDGNTRLCTATAAASMRESFGADGQPGSYDDIDTCDTLFIVGHNPGATGTVMWARMADRLADKANAPKLVVMDPRTTTVGENATVHLKPKIGSNLAVLNGLQRLLIVNGWIDKEYIEKSVCDFDNLKTVVNEYTPERVEELSGVPPQDLEAAAKILGTGKRLLSTALQGVYQSNQATASACAINNINLMRGMIGKPGCGLFQMNGQPTAQNNRETGCDGEYPCFRNYMNPEHMRTLAEAWNVNPIDIPHHAQPTHINDLLLMMETGSIEMLWISGTNPAVSLPELERIRSILTEGNMFIIAQDIFPTETTALADVILPAAGWGEKTGCYTNVDRTVHLSNKAVEPPGEARSDLDIWVDYATRMNFTDKDGKPLVHWKTASEAFEVWRKMSKDTLCDYSGLSYEKLNGSNGIQWPCNAKNPEGTPRLYTEGRFPTTQDVVQTYTSDLETGTPLQLPQFNTLNPNGRAIFKTCHFHYTDDMPSEEYPFAIATGRRVYHWHTRSKTGRVQKLHDAMPNNWLQMHADDAKRLDINDGDEVVVRSKYGKVQLPVRIGNIEAGNVFTFFHFGSHDAFDVEGKARAANELTRSGWDPISKQPYFKTGSCRIEKCQPGEVQIHDQQQDAVKKAQARTETTLSETIRKEGRTRHLEDFIGLWVAASKSFHKTADQVANKHQKTREYEISTGLKILMTLQEDAMRKMQFLIDEYGSNEDKARHTNVSHIHDALFPEHRAGCTGGLDLMLDLQGLNAILHLTLSYLIPLKQAVQALHQQKELDACLQASKQFERCQAWVTYQIQVRGPQLLIVPSLSGTGQLSD